LSGKSLETFHVGEFSTFAATVNRIISVAVHVKKFHSFSVGKCRNWPGEVGKFVVSGKWQHC